MTTIKDGVVIAALQEHSTVFFCTPDRTECVFYPFPLADDPATTLLIEITAHEEAEELDLKVVLAVLPDEARVRSQVALLLAQLSGRRRYVQFGLHAEAVVAVMAVELAFSEVEARRRAFLLSLRRLLRAVTEERPRILATARRRARRPRPSKLERELGDILREFDA